MDKASGSFGFSLGASPPTYDSGPERLNSDGIIELLKELGAEVTEESLSLIPVLVSSLNHHNPFVVRQSISSGTSLFCTLLEEMALQFHRLGKFEGWLEEFWTGMVNFLDTVRGLALEPGSVATKVLAVKFLEISVLLFTSDANDNEESHKEGMRQKFNASWLGSSHPVLSSSFLTSEANKIVGLMLDILQPVKTTYGSFTIVIINSLAAIARKRPVHYNRIISAFISFNSSLETKKAGHCPSIRYSLRTAFLGFLRSTHPLLLESREKLVSILRSMNFGEAADQISRQMIKMSRNMERVVHNSRTYKDDPSSGRLFVHDDVTKKRTRMDPNDSSATSNDSSSKRARFSRPDILSEPAEESRDFMLNGDDDGGGEFDGDIESIIDNTKCSILASDLEAVEQMLAAIAALLAEGDRGIDSLDLVISTIDPDLMANIVIENMKNIPEPSFLPTKKDNLSEGAHASLTNIPLDDGSATSRSASFRNHTQIVPGTSIASGAGISTSEILSSSLPNIDTKRDPRRDPRRLDPRRIISADSQESASLIFENISLVPAGLHQSSGMNIPVSDATDAETCPFPSMSRREDEQAECLDARMVQDAVVKDESLVQSVSFERETSLDFLSPQVVLSPLQIDQEPSVSTSSDNVVHDTIDAHLIEAEQSEFLSITSIFEDACHNLHTPPSYVDITENQRREMLRLAVLRIIKDCKVVRVSGSDQTRLPLLSRLISQADTYDDIITSLQKHIISDYHSQKGHELSMNILYNLYTVIVSDSDDPSSSVASDVYENFLLSVAKSLLESLPATDKSFSRLLGEAPYLPPSALALLEDLRFSLGSDHHEKDCCDGDHITQGLGAVWNLILARPHDRQACLSIALKCAVHSQDDIRAKAVRLVANKLYSLCYASEQIEHFATARLLSIVDHHIPEPKLEEADLCEQRRETACQETSVTGSQNMDSAASDSESVRSSPASVHNSLHLSLPQVQSQASLFFSLCTKKPSLLRLIFDVYKRCQRAVKQFIHRHLPIILRSLGSTNPELLLIISDPPDGCENLIMLVLQTLAEEATPSVELIAAVKCLFETKIKDVAILIPMLSSLSKDEVLPILPRLVDLPLERFQAALAQILQGSAHTGPALSPVEVLVAVHGIDPDKDGVALKKIMDACTACFEQRTVFTQHVLAKSLSLLVDQMPLPLLFMRTVIQAIDAFPTMVEFVMEILSKLVSKQIWKMPKLWVGFLKCVSQTIPHSFPVLLQLPPPQLDSALNRHANLRGFLSSYSSQPSIQSSLSRQTLAVLGLGNNEVPEQSLGS